MRFLERRGFVHSRTVVLSALDPRRVETAELARRRAAAEHQGYGLVPYADVDLEALFALAQALSADEPGEDEPRRLSFDEWRPDLFDGPDLAREGSFAVVATEGPVAYSALSIDPGTGRGRNEGTAARGAPGAVGSRRSRSSPSSPGPPSTASSGS